VERSDTHRFTRFRAAQTSFRGDAQHPTMVRNCAPENIEIPDRRFASSGMTALPDEKGADE
jgi:hypothetical protein